MAIPNDSDRQSRLVWLVLVIVGALLCIVGWTRWAGAQQVGPARAAAPLEPIEAVLDAFRLHPVVALDDGREHGDEEARAFTVALIRDPRFSAVANDVVLECCNARYQDRIDRFVRGEDVSPELLGDLWRNTTQVNATQRDCAGCETLFRTVRAVNASRPRERWLRILLGDPPIDWDLVRTRADHTKWLEQRDTYPADLIQREVLAPLRRALIVYGGMHLQRKNLLANYESDGLAETLVSRLERSAGVRVFSVYAPSNAEKIQPDIAGWPAPRLALVRGTILGAEDFSFFYAHPVPRVAMRDGKPDFSSPVPRDQWRSLRMEDQFDAILYLGPTMTHRAALSPDMCVDTGYMKTLRERMALVNLEPEVDRLNAYCKEHGVGR